VNIQHGIKCWLGLVRVIISSNLDVAKKAQKALYRFQNTEYTSSEIAKRTKNTLVVGCRDSRPLFILCQPHDYSKSIASVEGSAEIEPAHATQCAPGESKHAPSVDERAHTQPAFTHSKFRLSRSTIQIKLPPSTYTTKFTIPPSIEQRRPFSLV
jgi:hypothetical protein